MPEKPYRTLTGEGSSQVEDRKSKFIGRAAHVESDEEAYAYIDQAKRAERGARHHAYAFSIGADSFVVRSSDDGEPSGTAGRPCLEAIKVIGLTDCIVVVSRYFGGTLLGTGGLVRAYGAAAREAVKAAGRGIRVLYWKVEITFDYGDWDKSSVYISKSKVEELKVSFSEKVTADMLVESSKYESFAHELTQLTAGRAEIRQKGEIGILQRE